MKIRIEVSWDKDRVSLWWGWVGISSCRIFTAKFAKIFAKIRKEKIASFSLIASTNFALNLCELCG